MLFFDLLKQTRLAPCLETRCWFYEQAACQELIAIILELAQAYTGGQALWDRPGRPLGMGWLEEQMEYHRSGSLLPSCQSQVCYSAMVGHQVSG